MSEKLRIEIAQNMSLNANQFYAFNQCLEKSKSLHLPNLNRVANLDSHQYEFQNAEYPVILSEIKNFENNFEKCLIEVNFNLNEIEKMNEIYQQLNPKQKNKDFSYSDFKQSVKELKVKTRKKYYQLQAQKVAAYSGEDLADHFAASLVNFRFKNKNVYREIFIEENFYFPNRNIKCDIKDINLNIQDFGLLYNIHRPSCWRYKSIINFLMKYKKHPALL